jgi:transcription initiation factor TFIIE subunit alpha
MLDKLLKEVVVITVGKQAEGIADLLNSKKHVNEFNIAKKLDLTINQTRNILYKISNVGLVSSLRKKDKKKGWYTYFWKFEILKSLEFLKNILLKNIEELESQIHDRRTKVFYICKRCNIEVNEEEALSMNFGCPECGDVFEIKDNDQFLKEMDKHLFKLREKLEIVDIEIEKENICLDKIKQKELKIIEKEKDKKKAIAAAKRKKTREAKQKTQNKSVKKKVVKKKPVKKKVVKKKPVTKKKVVKKKPVKKKTLKKTPPKKARAKNHKKSSK